MLPFGGIEINDQIDEGQRSVADEKGCNDRDSAGDNKTAVALKVEIIVDQKKVLVAVDGGGVRGDGNEGAYGADPRELHDAHDEEGKKYDNQLPFFPPVEDGEYLFKPQLSAYPKIP
jgi:hypothetical protein